MLVQVPGSTQYQVPVPENLFYLLTRTDRTVHCTLVVYPYYLRIHSVIQKSFTGTCNPCCSPAVSVHMYLALCTGTCTGTIFCADLLLLTTVLLSILHTTVTLITFFSRNIVHVYIYFANSHNFKNFRKDAPNMVLSNEPLETTSYIGMQKTRDFWSKKLKLCRNPRIKFLGARFPHCHHEKS